ncbi:hypothetical protein HALLA_05425 [Halostagnicola larsenii XH-48]|uniref:Uncharacterized protein n=1 Tax=Halostagnicola larsenii XH-48 TaxID=797299 RepID=W0JTY9_9EURY|nr:hypothetical protein [Halostagnicola larsenii]AHG00710.1 hypothetical protein HALLA_05425 [Halostagnicola larsenii XH-48]
MVPTPTEPDEYATDPDESPSGFWWHVGRITDRLDDLAVFALVPLLTALLNVSNVRRTLAPNRGFSINLEFALPSTLLDLWSLATPPEPAPASTGGVYGSPATDPTSPTGGTPPSGFDGGGPTPGGTDLTVDTPFDIVVGLLESIGLAILPLIVIGAIVSVVVIAVLEAIYVGGLDRRLEHERIEPVACVLRYAPRLVLYNLLIIGVFAVLAPVLLVAPPLVLLAFPVMIVLAYLFYAVPFLFVVDDARFLEAFRRSHRMAVDGGAYFWFAVWHAVTAAVASLVLSILVSIGGPVGLLLALGLATSLGLVLTAATVSFLRELVELEGQRWTM